MAFRGFVEELKNYEEIDVDVIRVVAKKYLRRHQSLLNQKGVLTINRDLVFLDYWIEDLANHFATCKQNYDAYFLEFKSFCPVILLLILGNFIVDESGYEL